MRRVHTAHMRLVIQFPINHIATYIHGLCVTEQINVYSSMHVHTEFSREQ